MIDVNLLPEQNVISTKSKRLQRLTILGFFLISALIVSINLILLIYTRVQEERVKNLASSKETAEAKLRERETTARNLIYLKNKARGLKLISQKGFNFSDSLSYLLRLFPREVQIQRIKIEDNAKVSFTVGTSSPQVLAAFTRKLGNEASIKFPKLSGLQLQEDGIYVLTLSGVYGPKLVASFNE